MILVRVINHDNDPDKTEHSVPCRLTALKGGAAGPSGGLDVKVYPWLGLD